MCYCPTPTLHLNLALTGDWISTFPQKPPSVWFISVLNYGDMGQCPEKSPSPCNTYVIPVSLYTFMSSFDSKHTGWFCFSSVLLLLWIQVTTQKKLCPTESEKDWDEGKKNNRMPREARNGKVVEKTTGGLRAEERIKREIRDEKWNVNQ